MNSLLRCFLIAIATTSSIAHAECTFTTPDGWAGKTIRWEGECQSGRADGLGVLKLMDGGKVKLSFFGRLKNGEPVLGFLESDGGFQAGRFKDGKELPPDDELNPPKTMEIAFSEAEKAAKFVAGRFRAAGNTASAAYYENKALHLRDAWGE